MAASHVNPRAILAAGTRIITKVDTQPIGGGQSSPAGIVGIIVETPSDPDHAYRVRFVNGTESTVRRREIEVLSQHQSEGIRMASRGALLEYDLERYVIYRCIVGSRAYGLEHEESDTDRRGIYLPPAELHWSLHGVPQQLENHATQECYWELQKFLVLALKANPNILESIYSPLVEDVQPIARELLDMKEAFLSKLVYATYNGYVLSQFKKMNRDMRNAGRVKPKHAMHLIRLLLSGIHLLREGTVPVRVEAHRDRLLAIRDEAMSWDEVNAWRLKLHAEFDEAVESTPLPDRPDYRRINDYLVRARSSMVAQA